MLRDIFSSRTRTWTIAIILTVVTIVLVGGIIGILFGKNESWDIGCTTESKLCHDGSSVGRSGPKCEFAKCPGEDVTSDKYLIFEKNSSWGPCPIKGEGACTEHILLYNDGTLEYSGGGGSGDVFRLDSSDIIQFQEFVEQTGIMEKNCDAKPALDYSANYYFYPDKEVIFPGCGEELRIIDNYIDLKVKTSAAPSTIDSNNWKTYRSEEYGFEVKYPENWLVGTSPGALIKIKGPNLDSYFEVVEYKNEKKLNLDNWLKSTTIFNGRANIKTTAKEVFINDARAYRVDSGLSPPNMLFEIIAIMDAKFRVFGLNAYSERLSDKVILEKILSTFELINLYDTPAPSTDSTSTLEVNPIQDWKTYTNDEYRFEFRYPKNWKIEENANPDNSLYEVYITNPDFPKVMYDCCYTEEEIEESGQIPKLTVSIIDSKNASSSKEYWGNQSVELYNKLIVKGYSSEEAGKIVSFIPTVEGDSSKRKDSCSKSELLEVNYSVVILSSGCIQGIMSKTQAIIMVEADYYLGLFDEASEYYRIGKFDQILSTIQFK